MVMCARRRHELDGVVGVVSSLVSAPLPRQAQSQTSNGATPIKVENIFLKMLRGASVDDRRRRVVSSSSYCIFALIES